MRRLAGCAALIAGAWAGVAAAADSSAVLAARQEQARKQRSELRVRIQKLQKDIDQQEASRHEAADALQASESAISSIDRRLVELADQKHAAEDDLARIATDTAARRKELAARQAELAAQLRSEYASGLSPWTALLSGNDPQAIGRELGYLGYVSKARADTLRAIRRVLQELESLRARAEARRKELLEVAQQTEQQKEELERQKAEHQKVLASIDAQLKQQRGQAHTLEHNDQRMGRLIEGLDQAIAQQREAERKERERRKAEAERKAREALEARRRQAEQAARQAAQARKEAQARQEAQAQQQAQEQAQEQARQAREQVEAARAQARQAEAQKAEAEKARQAQQQAAPAAPQAAPSLPPPGGFSGLKHGLPYPVHGEVQGRFGMSRPDGGLWRGIVLRTAAGTAVHAVAPGRVVYASWLRGFGNILIIDHGDKYLSIYGYNQSLLKQVGDVVRAGETIATVGATGGQVEPGLYFEIRHAGVPVNPLLWLGH
ncbi:peptidase [Candidimonas nitroreducens]|uniref:Peptidase n=1 Tax=Candidimonas nitroreducens TaxID=683354 RepID=A0A225MB46_9BURK|nr:peptidase [Candidimonas nitroreducens]